MRAKQQAARGLLVILAMTTMTRGQGLPPLEQIESSLIPIQRFDTRMPGAGAASLPVSFAAGQINGDDSDDTAVSNSDGTVTVYFGGGGTLQSPPLHFDTGAESLGKLIVCDLNPPSEGTGFADIAVTAPKDGEVIVYFSDGLGGFNPPIRLDAFQGVRDLAAGNFDGVGGVDLVVAGPVIGLRHYRNDWEPGLILTEDNFVATDVAGSSSIVGHRGVDLIAVPVPDSDRDQLVAKPTGEGPIGIFGVDRIVTDNPNPLWEEFFIGSELIITEIGANTDLIAGFPGDWIEIFNHSNEDINLAEAGFGLTDDPNFPNRWSFPTGMVIRARQFLVVKASGRDFHIPGTDIVETNFSLDASGGFVGLTQTGVVKDPSGGSSINFPPQFPGVSFGLNHRGELRFFPLPSPGHANNHGVEASQLTLSEVIGVRRVQEAGTTTIEIRFENPAHLEAVWLIVSVDNRERFLPMSPIPDRSGWRTVQLPSILLDSEKELRVHATLRGGLQRRLEVEDSPGPESPPDLLALRLLATIPSNVSGPMAIASLLSPFPDLVAFDPEASALRFHRGNASSQHFDHALDALEIPVPEGVRAVVAGDWDGDGRNDLAVVLRDVDRLVLFVNRFGIGFDRFDEIALGKDPRGVVIANLDPASNQSDLVALNRTSADLSVVHIVRDGVFGLAKATNVFATAGRVSSMQVKDIDQDGHLDVIVTDPANEEMLIFFGSSDGSLSPPQSISIPSDIVHSFIEDYDGDGQLEFGFSSLEAFAPLFERVSAGGDRMTAENFSIDQGEPGTLKGILYTKSTDLDGDEIKDIIAFRYDCRLLLYHASPTGTDITMNLVFDEMTDPELPIEYGHIDSDVFPDLVGLAQDGRVLLFLSGGSSLIDEDHTEMEPIEIPLPEGTTGANQIWVGDLDDGNNQADVLAATDNGIFLLSDFDGGAFEREATRVVDTGDDPISSLVVADLDGDGKKEIVLGCDRRACIIILIQDGAGGFRRSLTLDVPSASLLDARDLDGDGLPDLIGGGENGFWTALTATEPSGSSEPQTHGARQRPIPEIQVLSVGTDTLNPDQPMRFSYLTPGDPFLPPIRVSVVFERLDLPVGHEDRSGRVVLFDNGLHNDGEALDGEWAGEHRFPEEAEIRYFWEVINVIGERATLPRDVVSFSDPDQDVEYYFLKIGTLSGLRFSEISIGDPAFIEIENISSEGRSLAGMSIASALQGDPSQSFHFALETVLGPGEVLVIPVGDGLAGGAGAPIDLLSDGGGELLLVDDGLLGGRRVLGKVVYPALDGSQSYVRVTDELWRITDLGSRGARNPDEPFVGEAFTDAGESVGVVEGLNTIRDLSYVSPEPFTGDGTYQIQLGEVIAGAAASPQLGLIEIPSVGRSTAEIGGTLATTGGAPTTITLFCGERDEGKNPSNWPISVDLLSESNAFAFFLPGLLEDTLHHFRIRAENAVGADWSTSKSFRTLTTDAPRIDRDGARVLNLTTVSAEIEVDVADPGTSEIVSVRIHSGLEDAGVAVWENVTPAEFIESRSRWVAQITGLAPNQPYFYRVEATNSNGKSAFSPVTQSFTTWTMARAIEEFLVVAEFMYHPQLLDGDPWRREYIELKNLHTSIPLDVSGLIVTVSDLQGRSAIIDFRDLDLSLNHILGPEESAVLVADVEAFRAIYDGDDAPKILGSWWSPAFDAALPRTDLGSTGMPDDGGVVSLSHSGSNHSFFEFSYGDRAPWPPQADGEGWSLTLINPLLDPNDARNWRPEVFGSPGIPPDDPTNIGRALDSLWVSEIVLRGTPLIELVNFGRLPIDLNHLKIDGRMVFKFAEQRILNTDERILVVRNREDFSEEVQGRIAGEFGDFFPESDHVVITISGILLHDFRTRDPGWPADENEVIEVLNPALRSNLSDGRYWIGHFNPTPGEQSALQRRARNIILTEFRAGTGPFEALEFRNIGSVAEDLTNVVIDGEFNFEFRAGTVLGPGKYFFLFRDGFRTRVEEDQPAALWGELQADVWTDGRISSGNGGFSILFEDRVAMEFFYSEDAGWLLSGEAWDAPFALKDPHGTLPHEFGLLERWEQLAPSNTPGGAWTSYERWCAQFFDEADRIAGIAARGLNPDGDGFTNWEEFAFGGDPTLHDANLVSKNQDGGHRTFEIHRTPTFPLNLAFGVWSQDFAGKWSQTLDYEVTRFGLEGSMVSAKYTSTRKVGEQDFEVRPAQPPFSQWMEDNGLEDENGDPDSDGFTNFLEWALLGDPMLPGAIGPEMFLEDVNGAYYPAFRFSSPAGVTPTMECSTDLATWRNCREAIRSVTNNDDGAIDYVFRYPVAISLPANFNGRESQFYRMRFEKSR